ncbi:MAG: glycosyltransferase family 2 protein [Anaerolineae bacterium]|nr:glycosyltransferase family 2 protein [Anaerolineae bacterium]
MVSKELSILIPMYNEQTTIGATLAELIKEGFNERYNIIICDDDSGDTSMEIVQKIAQNHNNISVIQNKPNGKKIGAIKTGLEKVKTTYVLLLDADAMVKEVSASLDVLIERMKAQKLAAMGFIVRLPAGTFLESLQALEYLLVTDRLRRLLGVVVCLSGSGVLWEVTKLKKVLKDHSGALPGDDLESTIRAAQLGYNLAYEDEKVFITTKPKQTLKELIKQRADIWDVGLIRTYLELQSALIQKGRYGAFFMSVFITDILAHPIKLLSLAGLIIVIGLALAESWGISLLSETATNTFINLLRITSLIYLALWLLNIIALIFSTPNLQGLRFGLYFTLYLALPLFPFLRGTEDIGRALGLTYLWWYIFCAILILYGKERKRVKILWLIFGVIMPIYFAFLVIFPRTIGFLKYGLARLYSQAFPLD